MTDEVMKEIDNAEQRALERLSSCGSGEYASQTEDLCKADIRELARIAREEHERAELNGRLAASGAQTMADCNAGLNELQAENARLKEALSKALDHVSEHLIGCLFCGEDEEFVEANGEVSAAHKKACWYYSAEAALRGDKE